MSYSSRQGPSCSIMAGDAGCVWTGTNIDTLRVVNVCVCVTQYSTHALNGKIIFSHISFEHGSLVSLLGE